MKRTLWAVLGLIGAVFSTGAEQPGPSLDRHYSLALYRPEVFRTIDGSTLLDRLPVRRFLDGTYFPVSSEIGRMGTAPIEPPTMAYVTSSEVQEINVARRHRADGKDFGSDGKDLAGDNAISQSNPLYYGGETGVFYGQWSGRHGGDVFGSYIQGGVGTDKFQINIGASYQEWNFHTPNGRH